MPSLQSLLFSLEPDMIHLIARRWGTDSLDKPIDDIRVDVLTAMNDPALLKETIEALPQMAQDGLNALVKSGGKIPASEFVQHFGEIREMGAGWRAREHPEEKPTSAAEMLWYAGLIGKAFFHDIDRPLEFVFIPDEVCKNIFVDHLESIAPPGRPALAGEHENEEPVSDILIQDACTLMAACRMGKDTTSLPLREIESKTLLALLKSTNVLSKTNVPNTEATRAFLEKPRLESLAVMIGRWQADPSFNELALIHELNLEGAIPVDVLRIRKLMLQTAFAVPKATWWSIPSLVEFFFRNHGNFLRPEGDYDSWFIRDSTTGEYLRGFSNWDKVEGRLIRFFFSRIFHWLGLVDVGLQAHSDRPASFRLSSWSECLLKGEAPPFPMGEDRIKITSKGHILIPDAAPLTIRYMLARYSEWDGWNKGEYTYHLTARSLERAQKSNLRMNLLLQLMARHSRAPLPKMLNQAVQRWAKIGPQSHLTKSVLLSVEQPVILDELKKSRARRFLGTELNPSTIVIKPGGERIIQECLLELGYFTGIEAEV
jgi:hypothetical protein